MGSDLRILHHSAEGDCFELGAISYLRTIVGWDELRAVPGAALTRDDSVVLLRKADPSLRSG